MVRRIEMLTEKDTEYERDMYGEKAGDDYVAKLKREYK